MFCTQSCSINNCKILCFIEMAIFRIELSLETQARTKQNFSVLIRKSNCTALVYLGLTVVAILACSVLHASV